MTGAYDRAFTDRLYAAVLRRAGLVLATICRARLVCEREGGVSDGRLAI